MSYRLLLGENVNFRRLWIGQIVSEVGDWLNNIAVLALVIQFAGPGLEGRAVATYAIVRHLPLFLFGPVAGVVVDRIDRRRVMIAADLIRAILALGFLLANWLAALRVIYLVAALLFSVSAFFNAAKRASIPNIVRGPSSLLSANSLSASTTAATIAIGSALGGVIATFVGRKPVFILNAATFLISAEMIRRVSVVRKSSMAGPDLEYSPDSVRGTGGGVSTLDERSQFNNQLVMHRRSAGTRNFGAALRKATIEFVEGLRYVRSVHILVAIFVTAAGWGLGNGVARALYSIFGARLGLASATGLVSRPTDFGISVLFVAMGFGGVMGAPLARRFNSGAREALGSRIGRSMIFDGIGLVVFSFMPTLWTAAAVLVAREINFAIWWTAQQTVMMGKIDDRYSGRVFATYETITTLTMVTSILCSGFAADRYGIRPVAASGGLVIVFSALLWFSMGRRIREHS